MDALPDGRLLASDTKGGVVCWLDAETGELLDTTPDGDGGAKHVVRSGDGLQVASKSNHGTVALWNPTSFTWVASFVSPPNGSARGGALPPMAEGWSPEVRPAATQSSSGIFQLATSN